MKTIPFDIKLRKDIQSEENHYTGRYKVQTKSGNHVRIICWDVKHSKYTIVALIEDSSNSYETAITFRNDGKYYGESSTDLCLVDTWEPKFKVGDTIKPIKQTLGLADKLTIKEIHNNRYYFSDDSWMCISGQDGWELVPKESKLAEFEKELANCLYKSIGVVCMDGMETLVKEFAPKLLELAKKEIIEKLKDE